MSLHDSDAAPPDILRSAVMFLLTMGTVFGAGMFWSTHGDDIVKKWNDDMAGMKADWNKATTPDREKQRRMFGMGWGGGAGMDHEQNFRDIARELDDSYARDSGYGGDFEAGGSFADEVRGL
ncbi:MAG: hypothetical protein ACYTGL_13570 [Planctomycetota bacterium]|jgi:hypothetical protein